MGDWEIGLLGDLGFMIWDFEKQVAIRYLLSARIIHHPCWGCLGCFVMLHSRPLTVVPAKCFGKQKSSRLRVPNEKLSPRYFG